MHATVAELLADPEIVAVTIATPDFAHVDIIRAALAAGKHVMSGKPLATTVAESEAVAVAVAVAVRGSGAPLRPQADDRLP